MIKFKDLSCLKFQELILKVAFSLNYGRTKCLTSFPTGATSSWGRKRKRAFTWTTWPKPLVTW